MAQNSHVSFLGKVLHGNLEGLFQQVDSSMAPRPPNARLRARPQGQSALQETGRWYLAVQAEGTRVDKQTGDKVGQDLLTHASLQPWSLKTLMPQTAHKQAGAEGARQGSW